MCKITFIKMRYCAIFLVLVANLDQWRHSFVDCKIITTELCGPDTLINLEPTGEASSVTILLNPRDHKRSCKINITAPSTHVVNLQWHEEHGDLLEHHSSSHSSTCPLSIFLPDDHNKAVWKGDPCEKDSLAEVDLLTPQLRLHWTPPRFSFHARGRKLVLTAVGQGTECKAEGMHTCMRIGWEPVLCVSEQLVCDGNPNCPKGASTSDEDEVLCKSHLLFQPSWQQLAEEVIKKFPPGIINSSWLQTKRQDGEMTTESVQLPPFINWKDLKKFEKTTSQPDAPHHHDGGDSVSAALAHYGPWGYLMLGMLICGTVLMFCGLWECCFRKPKPQLDLQSQQQPTTVLIINRSQDEMMSSHQPPNYDDLDQPPSYMTLFPNYKAEPEMVVNETVADTNAEELNLTTTRDDNEDDNPVNGDQDDDSDDESVHSINIEICRNSACDTASYHSAETERQSPTICIVTNL